MTFILPSRNTAYSKHTASQTDGPYCCLQLHSRSAPPPLHLCSLQPSHGNLLPSLKPTGHMASTWLKTLMARTPCYPTDSTPWSTVRRIGAYLSSCCATHFSLQTIPTGCYKLLSRSRTKMERAMTLISFSLGNDEGQDTLLESSSSVTIKTI